MRMHKPFAEGEYCDVPMEKVIVEDEESDALNLKKEIAEGEESDALIKK